MANRPFYLPFPVTLLAVLAVGTARADTVTVTGKVTLNSRALKEGKVLIYLENGKSLEIPIKAGTYSSNKVPVGQMPIVVRGKGVPARYTSVKTTPLRAVVKKPRNQIDIALVD